MDVTGEEQAKAPEELEEFNTGPARDRAGCRYKSKARNLSNSSVGNQSFQKSV